MIETGFGNIYTKPTSCCLHLRSKTMTCRDDERPGFLHHEEAACYWCDCTDESIGPDRNAAYHPACQAGRECYKAPPLI